MKTHTVPKSQIITRHPAFLEASNILVSMKGMREVMPPAGEH